MTARFPILATALVLTVVAGVRAQSPEQRQSDAQLAAPKLSANATVTLSVVQTPLKDLVAAIAKAGGITTVRYHSAVTALDTPSTAKFANSQIEDALHTALAGKALTFKVTSATSIFVYPDTPTNRDKYADSVHTFQAEHADVNSLLQIVSRSLALGADDLRPTIVTAREARTITVRATPETMTKIAKVIADNDK